MLEWSWYGIQFRISLWFPAAIIVMLTFDKTTLAAQCLLASVLHEGGHFLAMTAVGDRPSRLCFGVFGVRVERHSGPLSYPKSALVSVAGPLINLLCCGWFWGIGNSEAALVHGVLAGFHFLPILSLDGGEAAYALLCLVLKEEIAHRIMLVLSAVILFPLAVAGFLMLWKTGYNFSLLLLAIYLIALLIFKEKR